MQHLCGVSGAQRAYKGCEERNAAAEHVCTPAPVGRQIRPLPASKGAPVGVLLWRGPASRVAVARLGLPLAAATRLRRRPSARVPVRRRRLRSGAGRGAVGLSGAVAVGGAVGSLARRRLSAALTSALAAAAPALAAATAAAAFPARRLGGGLVVLLQGDAAGHLG